MDDEVAFITFEYKFTTVAICFIIFVELICDVVFCVVVCAYFLLFVVVDDFGVSVVVLC